jgi:hypothetical protein
VETLNVRETDNLIRDLAEYVKRGNGAFLRRSASIAGGSATLLSRK